MSAVADSRPSTRPAQSASFAQRIFFKQAHLQAAKFGALLSSYAKTLREVSSEIERRRPDDIAARLGGEASTYLEGAANYLTQTEGAELVQDVEGFAASQPALAVAAAITIGFATARILKVSSIASGTSA